MPLSDVGSICCKGVFSKKISEKWAKMFLLLLGQNILGPALIASAFLRKFELLATKVLFFLTILLTFLFTNLLTCLEL